MSILNASRIPAELKITGLRNCSNASIESGFQSSLKYFLLTCLVDILQITELPNEARTECVRAWMDWSVTHYTDRSCVWLYVMFLMVDALVSSQSLHFLRPRQHHMKSSLEGILPGNLKVHLIPTLLLPHTGSLSIWLQVLRTAAYNITLTGLMSSSAAGASK